MPVVLDLRSPNGQLRKYVFGKVCKNLGITRSRVIAWNLVNCLFMDKPRMLPVDPQVETYLINRFYQVDGAKNDWKTVRFLYHYFLESGKQELGYVVNRYERRLLVSLGEPVFRVLRHAYALS